MPAKKIHPKILEDKLPIEAVGWTTPYFLDWLDQTTDQICAEQGGGWYWELDPTTWFTAWQRGMQYVILDKLTRSPQVLAEAAARLGMSTREKIPAGVQAKKGDN